MSEGYESEALLEKRFMNRLNAIGYKTVKISDEKQLTDHFRTLLNERNDERLKGTPLSDTEFSRVLHQMVGARNIFEIAQLLRGADIQPYGKIVIQRDDNSQLYLEFFDGHDYQNNTYEVTHQVTVNTKYVNRYDVTILINGLPIVQIELKKRGVDFSEAFHQIIRYRDESFRQLYRFVQLFVVSNGDETRYFANGDGKLNSNFMFYWTDRQNNWLNDIDAFTSSFFVPKRLHSMIAKYTIFDNDNQRMLIMRPYQVYATEAIVNQAKHHPEKNGFIWHTTGSGKTITAFKSAQRLTRETDAEKVIFLIDRSDLDLQTAKNFNSYLPKSVTNQPALDRTDDTRSLVKQLRSKDDPLIISTIQKMNVAISNPKYKKLLSQFHDQRVIFIEDEAHRSQFGEMRKNINNWFKNSEHFGFTGTPIFSENIGADGRTTKTLYDEELHHYLIKDAIRDHNVLGFSVQYIGTIKGKDTTIDDEKVPGIDTKAAFESPERLKQVATHIMLNHGNVTKNRQYNAIFTVPSTNIALKYYEVFKKLKEESNSDLKITTIFTWAENEKDAEKKQDEKFKTSRHGLDAVIDDYNHQYGTAFSTDKFSDYFGDVSKRMKEHNAQTPDDNIDILIVVNMFLTGFDSPKLSTLYVDRRLQWQGLLQAFSRTNRIEKQSKPFGNIICYRNIKKETDDAIKLFSGGSGNFVVVPSYQELADQFDDKIKRLKEVAITPGDVDDLHNQGEDKLKDFVLAFRDVLRVQNKIRVYDDFSWDKFENQLSEQEMEQYRSKYFAAHQALEQEEDGGGEKASILDDIDFEIELLETDKIDVEYIMNLIKSINLGSKESKKSDTNKIKRMLNNADNPELKSKADLLADFLDQIIPKLQSDANVSNELNKYLAKRRQNEIQQFSEKNKIPLDIIDHQLSDYDFYGRTNSQEVMKALSEAGYDFKQKITIKKRIKSFVQKTIKRFAMS
ncbi:type I restriction endonuclease subunit R [Lentilactobacillus hilgardii]|uniref:type I restriction endonuclease subunit R n=1 Tax=Lentilactobacillus hilgardii TaxID=1588 RepID=UPI0002F98B17|nr:type I restriction endonuclease subunit R [Lentilactobacillus hilgardii]MCT3391055.1 type I restriction endonuclease subunit R [Lentilactobacillus hilgardii]RRG11751.1 MAG: type I restriction endonuclease subunit R [Lactobacillus sp.]